MTSGELPEGVLKGQGGGADAGLGGDGAQGDLHAPLLQGVVSVDRSLRDVHIVLVLQRELNVAAGLFDFIHGDLGAALGSQAIDGGVASQRAGAAQLEGGAGVLLDGAGVGRVGGLGCPAAVTAAAAAGQQGHAESTRQCKRQEASLFHSGILL